MRAVLAIVALAIALTFIGGAGWIACRVAGADGASVAFGYVLYGAIATTFAALGAALVVGVYHLYLYLFTEQRPVSLFASVPRDSDDDE